MFKFLLQCDLFVLFFFFAVGILLNAVICYCRMVASQQGQRSALSQGERKKEKLRRRVIVDVTKRITKSECFARIQVDRFSGV